MNSNGKRLLGVETGVATIFNKWYEGLNDYDDDDDNSDCYLMTVMMQ